MIFRIKIWPKGYMHTAVREKKLARKNIFNLHKFPRSDWKKEWATTVKQGWTSKILHNIGYVPSINSESQSQPLITLEIHQTFCYFDEHIKFQWIGWAAVVLVVIMDMVKVEVEMMTAHWQSRWWSTLLMKFWALQFLPSNTFPTNKWSNPAFEISNPITAQRILPILSIKLIY